CFRNVPGAQLYPCLGQYDGGAPEFRTYCRRDCCGQWARRPYDARGRKSRGEMPVILHNRIPALAAALALASGLIAPGVAAERDFPVTPAGTYEYEVRHESLGKIGTYVNEISHEDGGIVVETEVDISAKILFVRVAREKAERRQFWKDGRLVSYKSVTRSGSKEAVTRGRAEGDRFILEGPRGRIEAPAGLFPINP